MQNKTGETFGEGRSGWASQDIYGQSINWEWEFGKIFDQCQFQFPMLKLSLGICLVAESSSSINMRFMTELTGDQEPKAVDIL